MRRDQRGEKGRKKKRKLNLTRRKRGKSARNFVSSKGSSPSLMLISFYSELGMFKRRRKKGQRGTEASQLEGTRLPAFAAGYWPTVRTN